MRCYGKTIMGAYGSGGSYGLQKRIQASTAWFAFQNCDNIVQQSHRIHDFSWTAVQYIGKESAIIGEGGGSYNRAGRSTSPDPRYRYVGIRSFGLRAVNGARQIDGGKLCPAQVCAAQVCAAQVRAAQVRAGQVRLF